MLHGPWAKLRGYSVTLALILALAECPKTRVVDERAVLGAITVVQMLRKMIEGKILCEPVLEHGSSSYRFSATGTYGAVLCPPTGTNDCGGGQGN